MFPLPSNLTSPTTETDYGGGSPTGFCVSPAMAAILPDDLIVLILQKTNLRCLLRCKSVCKHWLALASDELASRDHPFPLPPGLITQSYFDKPKLVSLNGDGPRRIRLRIPGIAKAHLRIAASGNGLLFLLQYLPDGRIGDDCYLYNPNTWEYAIVPRPTRWQHNDPCVPISFPQDEALLIGLACDLPDHGGAVIVSVFPIRTADRCQSNFGFEIYTLESRVWRVSAAKSGVAREIDRITGIAGVCNAGAVFYKSRLYWCFCDTDLLEFDPVTEKASWIHGDLDYDADLDYDGDLDPGLPDWYVWFGEYRGALIVISIKTLSYLLQAYFMEKDSPSSWKRTLISSTSLQQLTPQLDDWKREYDFHVFHPVGLLLRVDSGDVVVVLSTRCDKLLALDIQTMRLQVIMEDDDNAFMDEQLCVPFVDEQLCVPYSPSTGSLDRWTRKSEVAEIIEHEADEEYVPDHAEEPTIGHVAMEF